MIARTMTTLYIEEDNTHRSTFILYTLLHTISDDLAKWIQPHRTANSRQGHLWDTLMTRPMCYSKYSYSCNLMTPYSLNLTPAFSIQTILSIRIFKLETHNFVDYGYGPMPLNRGLSRRPIDGDIEKEQTQLNLFLFSVKRSIGKK